MSLYSICMIKIGSEFSSHQLRMRIHRPTFIPYAGRVKKCLMCWVDFVTESLFNDPDLIDEWVDKK
jgi:hypothetical protein